MIIPIANQQLAYGDSASNNLFNLSKNGNSGDPQIAVSGNNVYLLWVSVVRENAEIFLSRSTDAGTSFSDPVNVSNTEGSSSEPSIAISGNNVYVVWEDTTPGRSNIFFARSSDAGKTFSSAINLSKDIKFSEVTHSIEPQVAVSGNNVYVVWFVADYNWGAIYFAQSADAGKSFNSSVNISRNSDGSAHNPKVAVTGNNVYLTWEKYSQNTLGQPYEDVYFSVSKDNGSNFSEPVVLTNHDATTPIEEIATSENNVYVVWFHSLAFEAGTPTNSGMFLATSSDHGTSFRNVINLSDSKSWGSGLPRIATSDNNVYVVWQTIHDAYGVFFVTSIDGGRTFSKPINLNPITRGVSPYESAPVASVASSGNNVFVVWRDGTPDGNFETFLVASNNRGFTFGKVINLSNNAGDTASDPRIAVSEDGVYVVWVDSIPSGSDVFLARLSTDELSFGKDSEAKVEPELPKVTGQPEEHVFTIWADPSEVSKAWHTYIYGRICPTAVPDVGREEITDPDTGNLIDPGSSLVTSYHMTAPDGKTNVWNEWRFRVTEFQQGFDTCNEAIPFVLSPESAGIYSVRAVAKWVSNGSMHEIESNTVNVLIKPPLFQNDRIENIEVEGMKELMGEQAYLSLLDWSSDGKSILLAYAKEGAFFLGVISTTGDYEVRALDPDVTFYNISQARFSPDGRYVLILAMPNETSRVALYLYDMNERKISQINSDRGYGYYGYADWTPDGNIAVYVGPVFDPITHESEKPSIHIMDLQGNTIETFQDMPEELTYIDVSPDGKEMLFTRSLYPVKPRVELTAFDIEKRQFNGILESDAIAYPRWSPSGELIVYHKYATSKPGGSSLIITTVDGTLNEWLYGGVYNAPHTSVISPDGKYIVFDLDQNRLAKMELTQPIPEFPFAIMIASVAIGVMLTVIRFRKLSK